MQRSIRVPIKGMLAAFLAALSLMVLHAAFNSGAASASTPCTQGDLSCYHEVTGVRFVSVTKCKDYALAHGFAVSASWIYCPIERPSGWVYLYVFSFRCERNTTYQWCIAHHEQ
jgi:hypothetical protein